MSEINDAIERRILGGKRLKELTHVPTTTDIDHRLVKTYSSNHPIRIIGTGETGEVLLSEEDRESHIHILGAPGEGKSKFLEMMVSRDIDALISGKSQAGACFIDSSDNGSTMKKVLKYCAKKKFEKVLVIDPHHISHPDYGYVVPINPIDYNAPSEAIQGHITDSMRVIWATKDFSDEAIITTYLPYVVDALHTAGMTLPDTECFTMWEMSGQRDKILARDDIKYMTRLTFNKVYGKQADWRDFQSTARRLNPFFSSSALKAMLGSVSGVDFQKLITDGWVILVNLYPVGVFEECHQRLLGTIVLNEVIRAMSRIKENTPEYSVPFYIYVDEFGQYATRKISSMLYYGRKSGLRLNLAHQEFAQVEDKQVLSSVKSAAKTKILFYVANPDDRHQMVRMMYGGELSDRAVEFTLSQTKSRHAVIKINKQPSTLARIVDWPDAAVTTEELKQYTLHLYKSNPHLYRPKGDVWEEITNRFAKPKTKPLGGRKAEPRRKKSNPDPPPASPLPDNPAASGTDAGSSEQEAPRSWKDIKTPFD